MQLVLMFKYKACFVLFSFLAFLCDSPNTFLYNPFSLSHKVEKRTFSKLKDLRIQIQLGYYLKDEALENNLYINELNEKLMQSIKTAAKKICSKTRKPGSSKLSTTTMQMLKQDESWKEERKRQITEQICEQSHP